MSTAEPIQKAQKAKTNKFVLILEQFLERDNLSAKSSTEQLSEHASELNALLSDWKARKCVKEALARGTEKRSAFSKEQIGALVPDQRNKIYSVRKRAQEVAKNEDHWSKSILSGTYRVPDIYSYIPTYRTQIGLLYMYSTYQVPDILS